jgi:putative ATPase
MSEGTQGQERLFEIEQAVGPGAGGSSADAPLATRMRPRTLDELAGQEHLLGPNAVLRRSLERGLLSSIILWGPPGSGKTTLAAIIAGMTKSRFVALSAVTAGVAELRKAVAEAAAVRSRGGERTILFIDELHRFNRSQQDAILPHVESGVVTLIGATTENPSFEVKSALLSRSRVFHLDPLTDADVETLVDRALSDEERGLGALRVRLTEPARRQLIGVANGDARIALNALELAASAVEPDAEGARVVELADVESALQQRALLYDKSGDQHYDLISAFIKSLRGSDPDAAIYWLARMLEAGEDLMFIARRLVILASEDVGLADPQAMTIAVSAQQAAHFVGMPEAMFPLAEATLYLATAPKSNSVLRAYGAAKADVESTRNEPVPLHLRNAVTGLMASMGYGRDYLYAHNSYRDREHPGQELPLAERLQDYLPDNVKGHEYYHPGRQGFEERLRTWLAERRGDNSDGTEQESGGSH